MVEIERQRPVCPDCGHGMQHGVKVLPVRYGGLVNGSVRTWFVRCPKCGKREVR